MSEDNDLNDFDETELRESLQSSRGYCPLPDSADARIESRVMDHFDATDPMKAIVESSIARPQRLASQHLADCARDRREPRRSHHRLAGRQSLQF